MSKEFPSLGSLQHLHRKALQETYNILTKDGKYNLSIDQLNDGKKIMPVDIAMRLGTKSNEIKEVMESLTSMGFYEKSGEQVFPKYMLTSEAIEYLSRELL